MSLFSAENIEAINESFDTNDEVNQIVESIIVDEALKMDQATLKLWCNSEEAKALCEAGALRKPTLMRLSKQDDAKRRTKIAAYTMARNNNDPLYKKLIKYRQLWKQTSDKLVQKYGSKAARVAYKGQQEYIKNYSKNLKAGKIHATKVTK